MTALYDDKIAFTLNEAAKATGLSRDTLYRKHHSGEITMRKIGSRTLIPVSDLKRLIDFAPALDKILP
jgi:excisionase family DNA binding protein